MMDATTTVQKNDVPANPPPTAVARPKPEKLIVHDNGPSAHLFDTARFEQAFRIAKAIAQASLIPDHLCLDKQKKELPIHMIEANCFLIVNQAIRWGMDPFALPPETYVVGGKLGYQGKLIAAVINARAGLSRPLQCMYNSEKGDDLAAVIFGSENPVPNEAWPLLKKYAKDEDGDAYTDLMALGVMCIRVSVGQAKTANDMWKKDPQQKLFYTGATKWARRHRPEIILGVLTDDDLERITINSTASPPALTMDDLAAKLEGPSPERVVSREPDNQAEPIAREIKDSSGEVIGTGTTESSQAPANKRWADWAEAFQGVQSITDNVDMKSRLRLEAQNDEDKAEIERLWAARAEAIRANRGERSKQQQGSLV